MPVLASPAVSFGGLVISRDLPARPTTYLDTRDGLTWGAFAVFGSPAPRIPSRVGPRPAPPAEHRARRPYYGPRTALPVRLGSCLSHAP